MAASPQFKVYTSKDAGEEYIGCTKYASDAAVLISVLGEGATIRNGHQRRDIVWTEGWDGLAGESYDTVEDAINARLSGHFPKNEPWDTSTIIRYV